MNKLSVLLLAILTACLATAQTKVEPLLSSGKIPRDFITTSASKYEADLKVLNHSTVKEKELRKKYLLSVNYNVDQILRSGLITFNNTISEYLNKVADKVFASDQALRSQLKFYPMSHSAMNAFTVNDGKIFINIGLLARLENEAQLAFILSHEAAHYIKQHSINAFIESDKIAKGKSKYNEDKSEAGAYLAKCAYSRENETEADLLGFEIYRKSGYALNEATAALELLVYADSPVEEGAFDLSILETRYMRFPPHVLLQKVDTLDVNEIKKADDRFNTHPNLEKRIKDLTDKASAENKIDGVVFLVSKSDFELVQTTALFEMARLYTINQNYVEGVYHAAFLLKKYPQNEFLQTCLLQNLYGWTSEAYAHPDFTYHYRNKKGSLQALYYLYDHLSGFEVNAIALRYGYQLQLTYPSSKVIDDINKNLVDELIDKGGLTLDEFADSSQYSDFVMEIMDKHTEPAPVVEKEKNFGLTTFKLKNNYTAKPVRYPKLVSLKYSFTWFAFADVKTDRSFVTFFLKNMARQTTSEYKNYEQRGVMLPDIDSVLLIAPKYIYQDLRRNEPFRYTVGEQKEVRAIAHIEDAARKAGVCLKVLTPLGMSDTAISAFNDYAILKSWLNERLERGDESTLTATDYNQVNQIAKKYGTKYGAMLFIEGEIRPPSLSVAEGIVICVFFPFYSPLTIYQMSRPLKSTQLLFALFNLETGELVYIKDVSLNVRDKPDIIKSNFYHVFNTLKH